MTRDGNCECPDFLAATEILHCRRVDRRKLEGTRGHAESEKTEEGSPK